MWGSHRSIVVAILSAATSIPIGGTEDLHGLTFRNGVMVFEKLGTMSYRTPEQSSARPVPMQVIDEAEQSSDSLPLQQRSKIKGVVGGAGFVPPPTIDIQKTAQKAR